MEEGETQRGLALVDVGAAAGDIDLSGQGGEESTGFHGGDYGKRRAMGRACNWARIERGGVLVR